LQEIDLGIFLTQNKHLSAEKFLLQGKDNTKELNWLLAEQLNLHLKAQRKLPQFAQNHCWFTSKSYEQASGEATALFKSELVQGKRLLDLSGGLGVDDWAFSSFFKEIISLDPDNFLNELVRFNYTKLDIETIKRLDSTAEDFLLRQDIGHFDLIYLDADRRSAQTKSFSLDHDSPNFLLLHARCMELSDTVMLKLSPMLDLAYLRQNLAGLQKLIILGDKNEVKEIIALIGKTPNKTIEIEAVLLQENQDTMRFSNMQNKATNVNNYIGLNTPEDFKKYLFEPHPCIIKAGLSKAYSQYFGLNQIAISSYLYTGAILPQNFMGRAFEIVQVFAYSKSKLSLYIKEQKLVQANITKRNFKQTVQEIRKTFKLADGGSDYLFFTTDANGIRLVFHAIK